MIISKENAQHYLWGESCDGWHLLKNDTLHIIHEKMPPNTKEIRHYHNESRQFFFLLSGKAELEAPNEGIEVAPLKPHCMMNHSGEETEFLVISSPGSHGDRVPCEL